MMARNACGREIPESLPGFERIAAFAGAFGAQGGEGSDARGRRKRLGAAPPSKLLASVEEAIRRTGLESGMTVSFHHHFREGDFVVNLVLDACARLGIHGLTIAPSSLTGVHAPWSGIAARASSGGSTRAASAGSSRRPSPPASSRSPS